MKQQAPKTLPQKAETIENTRKTADILIGAACHIKVPKSHGFVAFSLLFKPKKFGISETAIRLNRLYDKNTTVLQKWREKEPSGSLSLLRLYGLQRLSQRVRRCVIINPFQHSGVAVSKQVCNQVLRYALRRPERCSRVPKLMGRQ